MNEKKGLRNVVKLDDMQTRLMSGRVTVDAVFILRQMLKKYKMDGRKLHAVFVDLDKAFNCVPRKVGNKKKDVVERKDRLLQKCIRILKHQQKLMVGIKKI